MKAAAFDYLAPRSLDEAVEALSKHGDDARLLAGGQSLAPVLALRLASPTILIEVARSAPRVCERLQTARPLLEHAAAGSESRLVAALRAEEEVERDADCRYWAPLKRELEQLRRDR